jgi:hypothetical protein
MARDACSLPDAGPFEACGGLQAFETMEGFLSGGGASGGGPAARGPSLLRAPAPPDAAPVPASADSSWWVFYARFGAGMGGHRARDAPPEKRFSAPTTGIDPLCGRRRRDGDTLGTAGDLPGASDRPGARRGGSAARAGAARPGRCARRPLWSTGRGEPPAAPPPPPPTARPPVELNCPLTARNAPLPSIRPTHAGFPGCRRMSAPA